MFNKAIFLLFILPFSLIAQEYYPKNYGVKNENKNYAGFVRRVENFHKRLDALNINYANHLYEIEGELLSDNSGLSYQLQTLTDGKEIRYTLDGIKPSKESPLYKKPLKVSTNKIIQVRGFDASGRGGKSD